METNELLKEIFQLPVNRQILLAEQILEVAKGNSRKQLLQAGVDALMPDYQTDKKLTNFTALDTEDFYETR
jgi:hypothetical protein